MSAKLLAHTVLPLVILTMVAGGGCNRVVRGDRLANRLLAPSPGTERLKALRELGERDEEYQRQLVPVLQDALEHGDSYVRQNAAVTLGRLGALANPAVPALVRASGDAEEHVRFYAREALAALGHQVDETLAALCAEASSRAEDDDYGTRRSRAVQSIGFIASAQSVTATPLVAAVTRALHDDSWLTRVTAIRILEQFAVRSPADREAIAVSLDGVARDKHERIRRAAGAALERIDLTRHDRARSPRSHPP